MSYLTGDDGSYAKVDEYSESQVVLETTNYDGTQEQLQVENIKEENFETTTIPQNDGDDDESFHVTASTASSESSKPSVDIVMSGGDGIASSTKNEDVKLVKQLLDSESDDTPTSSNLLKTAIKEEEKEDESDFDFSAN